MHAKVNQAKANKDLNTLLRAIDETKEKGENGEIVLKFNPNAKNVYLDAKLSEFKTRLKAVKHCVSKWKRPN